MLSHRSSLGGPLPISLSPVICHHTPLPLHALPQPPIALVTPEGCLWFALFPVSYCLLLIDHPLLVPTPNFSSQSFSLPLSSIGGGRRQRERDLSLVLGCLVLGGESESPRAFLSLSFMFLFCFEIHFSLFLLFFG